MSDTIVIEAMEWHYVQINGKKTKIINLSYS